MPLATQRGRTLFFIITIVYQRVRVGSTRVRVRERLVMIIVQRLRGRLPLAPPARLLLRISTYTRALASLRALQGTSPLGSRAPSVPLPV